MTTLAVVLPLFESAAYIGEAIASLAMQEIPPDEVVVVDDASTDASARVAEEALRRHASALRATRVEVVRRTRNGGPGSARNEGIERTASELVFCLDADDRLAPDALRVMREEMERHALAMAVVGYASDPPGESFPDGEIDAWALRSLAPDIFALTDPLRTASHPAFVMGRASNVVVGRAWLGAHRYGDARLNEGVDLWYRVLKDVAAAGARAGLFAAPLIRFRVRPESLSHARIADWRALDVPPTVVRYRESDDADDRRMAAMIAQRWVAHARAMLAHDDFDRFAAHHRDVLDAFGVGHREVSA